MIPVVIGIRLRINILNEILLSEGQVLVRMRILSRLSLCTGSFRQALACVNCTSDYLFIYVVITANDSLDYDVA